jgi:flagellar protein FliO/FliZ
MLTSTGWVAAQEQAAGEVHDELRAPSEPASITSAHDSKLGQAKLGQAKPANDKRDATEAPSTSLRLRVKKPIALSEESPTDGWWYKLLACGFIVTGALWLYRRRAILKPSAERHSMKILGRTPVGVRSELLIVNVDGQKILLGVTPGSIQRLANLADPMDEVAQASDAPEVEQASEIEPGFEQFVGKAQRQLDEMSRVRKPSKGPRDGQARGLMDLLSGRRAG